MGILPPSCRGPKGLPGYPPNRANPTFRLSRGRAARFFEGEVSATDFGITEFQMDDPKFKAAIAVLRRLRDAGHETYFAGGCVRDLLRGLSPKDYDIATAARPEQVAALFPRTVEVGRAFGVIKVLIDGNEIEVTTFRSEGPYVDGRRPESVTFTTAEEDVRRRDFTINGLLWDPIEKKVLDFVGGQEDLKNRILRAIGDPSLRFEEDRLRMMRAIRFACQIGLKIEEATYAAIRAHSSGIVTISMERIRDEFKGILLSDRRSAGIEMLAETGLLRYFLPEVLALRGVAQPPEFHPEGDVWTHTLLALDQLKEPTFALALGTLLHDIAKPLTQTFDGNRIRFNGHDVRGASMARDICRRLRLSAEETECVEYLVASHMKFKDVRQMRESTLRRFLSEPHFPDLVRMCEADVLASNKDFSALEYVKTARERFSREPLRPPRLVSGYDLIQMGLTPGPIFSKILNELEDLQLEGKLSTREEALRTARRRVQEIAPGG